MAPVADIGNSSLTHSNEGYESVHCYGDLAYPFSTSTYSSQSLCSTSNALTPPGYSQTSLTIPPHAYYSAPIRTSHDEDSAAICVQAGINLPKVTSFSLSRSSFNTKIYVHINSPNEFMETSSSKFFLVFNSRKYPASIHELSQKDNTYTVTSEVPKLPDSFWQSSKMAVSLIIESRNGNVNELTVGEIEYSEKGSQNIDSSFTSQENHRKRKNLLVHSESMQVPAKKNSTQHLRSKDGFSNYHYSQTQSYPSSTQSGNFHDQTPSRSSPYGYSGPRIHESPIVKAPSLAENWSSSQNINSKLTHGIGIFQNSSIHPPSQTTASSSSNSANPPLFRTSTLQQSSGLANTTNCGRPSLPFNAYALYANKARLDIVGDLSSMVHGWTKEELDSRRRIVFFERSQSGSTITAKFRSMRADDQPIDSMCISCIYWEEKQDCFVTSVDTIFLLQKLVSAQFTVEEKNRIRRNLEWFRPLTVSKSKPESEEFFKIIMAYPAPKPRNIEKDVKVFHWNDLCGALKKIIGKYSASPSAVVPQTSSLLTSTSLASYASETSLTGSSYSSDHSQTSSPQSYSSSCGTSISYPTRISTPVANEKTSEMPTSHLNNSDPHDLPSLNPLESDVQNHWQMPSHHILLEHTQTQQPSNNYHRNSLGLRSCLQVGQPGLGNSFDFTNMTGSTRPSDL
ncbi:hypothetical protein K3495_g5045 [Podosphaera aphanis]|nr:hypothetical protein K3495_g5045 [Podosphaera aphanis]